MNMLRILHLSDTHLNGDSTLHSGVVDTVANLRAVLAELAHIGQLDLLVVSGDVSDDGSAESYELARTLLLDFARVRGAVVVLAMGNHDQRSAFRQVLSNGHPRADGTLLNGTSESGTEQKGNAGAGPICGVTMLAGFRVITVDSSVPGRTHGYLSPEQLHWLAGELAEDAQNGSILVIHHPPVEPVSPLHFGIELQNPGDLAHVLAESDVKLILSGHYHHHLADSIFTGERHIPVVVAAAVVHTNDVLAPIGHERAVTGSGGNVIELWATSAAKTARVRVLPLATRTGTEIFDLGPAEVAEISGRIAIRDEERLTMKIDSGEHNP